MVNPLTAAFEMGLIKAAEESGLTKSALAAGGLWRLLRPTKKVITETAKAGTKVSKSPTLERFLLTGEGAEALTYADKLKLLAKGPASLTAFGDPTRLSQAVSTPFRPFNILGSQGPRSAAHEMMGFGLLSGGLGALGAEPEKRLRGALLGFAGGAAGGLGWGVGSRLGKGAVSRLARRSKGFGKALERTRPAGKAPLSFRQILGSNIGLRPTTKQLGTWAVRGGLPLAGGMGLSMAGIPLGEKALGRIDPSFRRGVYTGALGRGASQLRLGLTPTATGSYRGGYYGPSN